MVRTRWSDERLDDMKASMDAGFQGVEGRLDRVDDRIERLQQTTIVVAISMCTMMFAGFGALITLFAMHF